MRRRLQYLLIFFLSFLVGTISIVVSNEPLKRAEPIAAHVIPESQTDQIPASPGKLSEGNCGPWTDEVSLGPIIDKWLREEAIKDVPYCSQNAIEATAYNPSNVHPEFIDLNDDGKDELAVRYLCSPTGNCSMNVYQRTRNSYRTIFSDRQMVNDFEKRGQLHKGFRDIQTRSHGSCCDGGQVLYRFSGRDYKPISCAEYSYWEQRQPGVIKDKPLITKRSCRAELDSQ